MSASNYSPRIAVAVIIANMIGTGVFTSLGFQLADISSGFVLLMLWVIGGLAAFCGALCYAELGARLPRSGGEYNFLSESIHPSLGFVSGWVSATIGFAAPTALVAITFGKYLNLVVGGLPETVAACLLVLVLAYVHASNHRRSGGTQFIFTAIKIVLIAGFCVAALVLAEPHKTTAFLPKTGDTEELFSGAFAVALIYVSYSYSGWNAATYFSGELENPQKSLPGILAIGAITVTLIYVLLNFTFLWVAPAEAMRGQIEIVYIAAQYAFGDSVAKITSLFLSLLLISTVSAMILAAPRVLQMIGQDFSAFRILARTNDDGIPYIAIYLQAVIAIILILTATFEFILVFSGFTLALNTFATVTGLFILRIRRPDEPRPFSTWGFPVTPLIFLGLTGWTIAHIAIHKPKEALYGGAIIVLGLIAYFLVRDRD